MADTEITMTFTDLIISSNDTLRNALRRMTTNKKGVLLVCDTDAHLVGVISDGDVRRSMLEDTLLIAPVSTMMNTDPITADSTEAAKDAMRRYGVVAVPVVGPDGVITEVVVQDRDQKTILKRDGFVERRKGPRVTNQNVVAIIPARGGSKRIPRKNMAMVAGMPLIAWAILSAKGSENVGRVIVSTDNAEIADEARSLGIEVPWMRPDELSGDTTPTLDVLMHALAWVVETEKPVPEFGVLLEPTAPMRRSQHIDQAINILATSDVDSVVSVCEVPHVFNPEELLVIDGENMRPYIKSSDMDSRKLRGQQSAVYVQNGLVYAFRIKSVLDQSSLYGKKTLPMITDWDEFLDVDTPEDLRMADYKLRQQFVQEQTG